MKRLLTVALALLAALILAGTVLAESTATDLATPTDVPAAEEAATPTDVPAAPAAEEAASATDIVVAAAAAAETQAQLTGPTYEDSFGTWGYALTDPRAATITAYQGDAAVLAVPAYVEGARVTALGDSCFAGNTALTAVQLPYGIQTLGDSAFEGCTALAEFAIPSSVQTLGSRTFADCTALSELFIPGSVQVLGNDLFAGCTQLTVRAFKGCAPAKYFTANPDAIPGELKVVTNNLPTRGKSEGPCTHAHIHYEMDWEQPGERHHCTCKDCGADLGYEPCVHGESGYCLYCSAER